MLKTAGNKKIGENDIENGFPVQLDGEVIKRFRDV